MDKALATPPGLLHRQHSPASPIGMALKQCDIDYELQAPLPLLPNIQWDYDALAAGRGPP